MRETWRVNGSERENLFPGSDRASNRSRTKFPSSQADAARYYSPRDRRSAAKILNIFDHSTSGEKFLFSVLAMLIGFVTFWMSFISVILNGSILILKLLTAVLLKCGRSARSLWRNIKAS